MSEKLQALDTLFRKALENNKEYWEERVMESAYIKIKKEIEPPTVEEVCEVLSEYVQNKITYNPRFGFMAGQKVIITLGPDDKLYFSRQYPPYIHEIVGRFCRGFDDYGNNK